MFKTLMFILLVSLSFLLTTISISSNASPVETFVFKDEVTKVRFQTLTKELRCPKCQNQDLADSSSLIATDLRKQIYTQLTQGRTDSEIINYMVDRYGEFVLYRPRVSSLTYALWFGPAVALLFGVIIVILVLRNRALVNEDKKLSKEQQTKLKQILAAQATTEESSTNKESKK